MSRVRILSIEVDKVTMTEAVDQCLAFLDDPRPHVVVTPNAEIAYRAGQEPALAALLKGADLVIPDGAGVVLASRILGDRLPEKVAGADLATNLLRTLSEQSRGRVYLLGAKPDVVARAVERIRARFPGLTVAGYRDGYFRPEEEPAVIEAIRAAQPDVLFVGLGSPRQEFWLQSHLAATGARVGLGIGGTIDVWADESNRAPEWAIKANLEWLWRIVKFGRYGRSLPPLIKFGLAVVRQRLRGR